ncbi:MAG: hypothetical protein HRT45_03630 [Bdellovibrionales bacterium]|nr:hypothetical protein [Bdellovibrionales bacterium]
MQLISSLSVLAFFALSAHASVDEITKDLAEYQGIYQLVSSSSERCPARVDLRLEKNSEYWVVQSGGDFYMRALGTEKTWKERDCEFSVKTDWSPGSQKSAVISEESIKCKGKPKTTYTKILELRENAVNISSFEYTEKNNRKIASKGPEIREEQAQKGYECSLDFMGPPKSIRTDLKLEKVSN